MNRRLDRLIAGVVRQGRLEVTWSDGSVSHYGEAEGHPARLRFLQASAERALLRNPELALGEGYMDGSIDFPGDSLRDFLLLANANLEHIKSVPLVAALVKIRYACRRWIQDNSMWRARRNIAHHYDLDERLYRLFLDSDMQYSCAYFETPGADLDEAQWAKKRHIAAKLALEPGQEVLDIGSGWGGLGLFLAEHAGVNVTGVTLSAEQHRVSNRRARDAGRDGQVRFELRDYRALDKDFDRIVSVGMFEHVGAAGHGEFFRTAARLLRPDGVMLLHAIGRFGPPATNTPFLDKYIFPGAYAPALSEVLAAIEKAGLLVADVEILRHHYADTLAAWRQRFRGNWDEAARLYDERFCRMWDYYLASCEAAFRVGSMMVFQIQIARNFSALPFTRDYMFAAEAAIEDSAGAAHARYGAARPRRSQAG